MASKRTGKPICAPPRLSKVSPMLRLKQFQCWSDCQWLCLVLGRWTTAAFLYASLLQAFDGVMSLVLCPQSLSPTPQHGFRSSGTQATCDHCLPRQSTSICSVISLKSSMSRTVDPQESLNWNVEHCHMPVWTSHSTFYLLSVAGSLSLWEWLHVCSGCRSSRQSSGEHVWLLPFPLSSWTLSPYRRHCLHGWWSHFALQWSPTLIGLWWPNHPCRLNHRVVTWPIIFDTVCSLYILLCQTDF